MTKRILHQTTEGRPPLSTLDAVLLAPLAAPFLLPPLALLGWGAYRIGAGYFAALHAPATPAAWWQWPWNWPGARLVEAIAGALGLPPAADFSFSNPLHLFADLAVIDRALMALFANGIIALIPLFLLALLSVTAVKVCCRAWARRPASRIE